MEQSESSGALKKDTIGILPTALQSPGLLQPCPASAAAAAALSYSRMINLQNQLNLIGMTQPQIEINPLAVAWSNRCRI